MSHPVEAGQSGYDGDLVSNHGGDPAFGRMTTVRQDDDGGAGWHGGRQDGRGVVRMTRTRNLGEFGLMTYT